MSVVPRKPAKVSNTFRMLVLAIAVFSTVSIYAGETGSAHSNASTRTQEPITQELLTVDAFNYVQAKTAIQFDKYLAMADGKINHFAHVRNIASINAKSSKRLNRDTLYSVAIVDISQGATLLMPEAGDRYMSAQVVNELGFTNKVFHGGGRHRLTMEEFDTPFVWVLVRTHVYGSSERDLVSVHSLQDQLSITSASSNEYVHPNYDPESFERITQLLLQLGKGIRDNSGAAGSKEEVDPIKQLLATAYGFGTLPETESLLVNVEPNLPSDKAFTLTVSNVPVDGFWSVAVYNKDGYFEENKYNAYSFSDRTAERNADGSVTLHLGGEPSNVNYVPLPQGWNYVVRLYRPRAQLLDGSWIFPSVVEASTQTQ